MSLRVNFEDRYISERVTVKPGDMVCVRMGRGLPGNSRGKRAVQ